MSAGAAPASLAAVAQAGTEPANVTRSAALAADAPANDKATTAEVVAMIPSALLWRDRVVRSAMNVILRIGRAQLRAAARSRDRSDPKPACSTATRGGRRVGRN